MKEETEAANVEAAKPDESPKQRHKPKPKQDTLVLRYRVIFACVAAAAIAIVLLLNILPARSLEAAVRRNADAVLAARFSSAFPGRTAPVLGERVYPESGGAAFQFVFLAQGQGQEGLIFVVPVAGLSGPAASVFYCSKDDGARFIGNCAGRAGGPAAKGAQPPSLEISEGNLRKWASKIEEVARRILPDEADGAGAGSLEQ